MCAREVTAWSWTDDEVMSMENKCKYLSCIQNIHATLFYRQLGKTNDSFVGSGDSYSLHSTGLCILSSGLPAPSLTHTHSWSDKDTVITAVTAQRPAHYISVSLDPGDWSASTCLSCWNAQHDALSQLNTTAAAAKPVTLNSSLRGVSRPSANKSIKTARIS